MSFKTYAGLLVLMLVGLVAGTEYATNWIDIKPADSGAVAPAEGRMFWNTSSQQVNVYDANLQLVGLDGRLACDYLVYTNGTHYFAKNCSTGVVEKSGTDATAVMQYALDSGRAVGLSCGRFTLSDNPVVNNEGSVIWGFSRNCTVLSGRGIVVNASNTWIRSMFINVTGGQSGIALVRNNTISNLKFTDLEILHDSSNAWGIFLRGTVDFPKTNILIENNIIRGFDGGGTSTLGNIISEVTYNVLIKDNRLYNDGALNYEGWGDGAGNIANVTIVGNIMITKNTGSSGNMYLTGKKHSVLGNVFYTDGGYSISVGHTTNPAMLAEDVLIAGNQIFSNSEGLKTGRFSRDILFVGNQVHSAYNGIAGDGIQIVSNTFVNYFEDGSGGAEGLALAKDGDLNNSYIAYNTFKNYGRANAGFPGIDWWRNAGDLNNVTITGNLIYDDRNTKFMDYGIRLLTDSSDDLAKGLVITNNVIRGWKTASIFINKSQIFSLKIRYNEGFTTKNSGTTTVNSSDSVLIPHGLAGVPDVVTFSVNTSAVQPCWIAGKDSSNINITCSSAGTFDIYWYAEYKP